MRCPIFWFLPVAHIAEPPRRAHFGFFSAHLVADLFLLGKNFLILLVIRRANGRRALEHHVFNQMCDAGDAGAFIRTADVRDPAARDGRIIVSLDHEQSHSIAQRSFNDANFLGGKRGREYELKNGKGKDGQGVFN